MTLATVVTGANAASREAAIAVLIEPGISTALILEGLPNGKSPLDDMADTPALQITRIAPGCLCCTGNLTMRVTLNRLLRRRPDRMYIGLATSEHLERIRDFLTHAPYDTLLQLSEDLHA
ncbi:MAG TPA: GTPase [Noviherbaspirillum sp.]|uniref:GTPase n=1 Tax=Noviherbaspirillum sp. TaxID=1926288 RepID=UPI002B4A007A|nr:GTPase [Noviherbaspirillum sp.]HJV87327.1 GTPase [Noviherbaspirillum sp.]